MQISSSKKINNIRKPQPPAAEIKTSASVSGVVDSISDGFNSLPRWPQAAVRGMGSYAPASIGAAIGSQYGGLPGRIVGAAVGGLASYMFQTEIADGYPQQAKMTAGLSALVAAIQGGGGLSMSGVGISLAWGAGLGVAQEAFMPR